LRSGAGAGHVALTLEVLKLSGDESQTLRLLSLPLCLAGQLDRLLSEAFIPESRPEPRLAAGLSEKLLGVPSGAPVLRATEVF
jgi:hypothetical protein